MKNFTPMIAYKTRVNPRYTKAASSRRTPKLSRRTPNTLRNIFCLLLLFVSLPLCSADFHSTENFPTAYQGRFRTLDSVSRLWLQDFYHKEQLRDQDVSLFQTNSRSALNLLWQYHFQGSSFLNDAPFFWIHYSDTKTLLGLNQEKERFSYSELSQAFYQQHNTNLQAIQYLIVQEFFAQQAPFKSNFTERKKELNALAPGLWVATKNGSLIVHNHPQDPPWHFLTPGMTITDNLNQRDNYNKKVADEIIHLLHLMASYANSRSLVEPDNRLLDDLSKEYSKQGTSPSLISKELSDRFPLSTRLSRSGSTLKMLPTKLGKEEWVSLHALGIKTYNSDSGNLQFVNNFTLFSDNHFAFLQKAYIALAYDQNEKNIAAFVNAYDAAYTDLAGHKYKSASGKSLFYPTKGQLYIETLYHKIPSVSIIIGFYLSSLLFFICAAPLKKQLCSSIGFALAFVGFILHTLLLAMRCYILERPPVSNMFETVIYVPWIIMLFGIVIFRKQKFILIAGCLASIILLLLLQMTYINSHLENVQAVLDSQYWLLVHVLMVVGSYGAFILSGILGHFYLVSAAFYRYCDNDSKMNSIAQSILYTMYTGVALLIPGTILGGVWAAESWGRFWDWDPKESWAFISACVYLLVIHAYLFKRISDLGLAIGSIGGLIAISFTWYGVNYILGTGLHSYGFGKGGEIYYLSYVVAEIFFITTTIICYNRKTVKNT